MGPTGTKRDWERLGRTIRQYRIAAGIKKQADLAAAVGLSTRTIGNYERGRIPETAPTIPDGYYAIAAFFGWSRDSVEVVLAGGEPRPTGAGQGQQQSAAVAVEPLVESTFRLVDVARDRGAPDDLVARCRLAVSELIGWLAQQSLARSDVGLAAARPHAVGEGIPSDDAARIWGAMDRD